MKTIDFEDNVKVSQTAKMNGLNKALSIDKFYSMWTRTVKTS